jgi:hypothetical protein
VIVFVVGVAGPNETDLESTIVPDPPAPSGNRGRIHRDIGDFGRNRVEARRENACDAHQRDMDVKRRQILARVAHCYALDRTQNTRECVRRHKHDVAAHAHQRVEISGEL